MKKRMNMINKEVESKKYCEATILEKSSSSVLSSPNVSSPDTSLTTLNASATGKMLLAGSVATVGTGAAAIGGIALANMAGAHLSVLYATLSLTPIGWGLICVSVVGGAFAALWKRESEIKNFQQAMLKLVQTEFEKLLDPKQVSSLRESLGNLFDSFDNRASQLVDDANSMEASLKNLLESKQKKEIDLQAESIRLDALKVDVTSRWTEINEKYKGIFTSSR
jgi:hypothetical protein